MSTTTAAMLLIDADHRTRQLCASTQPIDRTRWETFEVTVHRCLHTLAGPSRRLNGHDGTAGAVVRTFQAYPAPLRPAPGETYSASEAARLLGVTTDRVRADIASGTLRADRVGREHRIAGEQLDRRPDLTPADPGDPHPLSRLTVALGALADVVAGPRPTHAPVLTDDAQIAAAMRQVLSMTAVAARHTLSRGPIEDADRPLLIAQYATRAVDALAGNSGHPQLWAMTSTSPPSTPTTPNDRLEHALRGWAATAAQHLKHPIPSTDVLRNIANQGVHILAAIDALLRASHRHTGHAPPPLAERLRQAAVTLRGAEHAWTGLTTGMPPSHEYVTASRAAFAVLNETTTAVRSPIGERAIGDRVDHDRALLDLSVATQDLASLLETVESLPHRLLESELLFVRARSVAPRADILEARSRGQLVVARSQDAPELVRATQEAARLARDVPGLLFAVLADRSFAPRASPAVTLAVPLL